MADDPGMANDDQLVVVMGDPRAAAIVAAIRAGAVEMLISLLAKHPEMVRAVIGEHEGEARSLLHVLTDWPGHFPNGPATVGALVAAGADVNAAFIGPHRETPLHWAASADDVAVMDALLDAGADIEADGAVIAGGTAMADATAFAQWNAARRLLERGARTNFFESAVMGLMARLESDLPNAGPRMVTEAFWGACHGGQLDAAQWLREQGADVNWVSSWDHSTPLDAALRSEADSVVEWLRHIGAVATNG